MKKQKIKINKKFNKGFTLIELLIVIAIIGIMTSALFVAMTKGGVNNALKVASRQIAGALKEAQTYALTGKQRDPERYPCAFKFSVEPGEDGAYYKIDYAYRSINEQCGKADEQGSGGLFFETFADPVKIVGVDKVTGGDVIFTVPHANYKVAEDPDSEKTEYIITKKNVEYRVIVYSSGRVVELSAGEEEENE